MNGIYGRVHSYESFGTLDGPGIRFVVFLQGCPLRCLYCHNPDTRDAGGGAPASSAEVAARIEQCGSYIAKGGATLSGGEPLMQPEFSLDILQRLSKAGIHTALDTAGSLPLEKTARVIDAADMLLLDIKASDPGLCRIMTGADNARSIETLRYCEKTGKDVWIRHVLVPGYTLNKEQLEGLADLLRPFGCVKRVSLLPYHKAGSYKLNRLGMADRLKNTPEPTDAEKVFAESVFYSRYGGAQT